MSFPFRYRRLAYAALNVTDLDRSVAFYRDLVGLNLSDRDEDRAALRCGDDHHNLLLYRAEAPGLKRLAFELESDADLAAAETHLKSRGIAVEAVAADELAGLKMGRAIRFREPVSGLCLEFFRGLQHMAIPYAPPHAKIERLGHVVVSVTDLEAVHGFLAEVLNFRTSDYVPGIVAFLRCFPNPLHHSLAIAAGPENRLHHVNFMVTDIDDVGRAIHRMQDAQVEIVFGPGRHPPSGSIFLYYLDPDGMTVEYSFGMEEFPEEAPRDPRMLEPVPASLDTWGARPAPNFAKVGTIEPAA
ncbi:VOC family protein [Marinibaculum pumilum]|uniref:VOC family protein n=1 Tax=Marinibaculum pumilum TaxID=1766165 RepID=A0ABV7L2J9_9PROT